MSDMVAYNIVLRVTRLFPIFLNQQQAYHNAPDRRDDGEITGKLGGGTSAGPGINGWYGQERHVGCQQHSSLSKRGA